MNSAQQRVGGTPTLTELVPIPVAGRDSAGNTGLGEVPGGEKIRQTYGIGCAR